MSLHSVFLLLVEDGWHDGHEAGGVGSVYSAGREIGELPNARNCERSLQQLLFRWMTRLNRSAKHGRAFGDARGRVEKGGRWDCSTLLLVLFAKLEGGFLAPRKAAEQ